MKTIVLLLLIGVSQWQQPVITTADETYCNARFDYCISYPGFLAAGPESENGDGRTFADKKGATILTVYGRLNQDAEGNPVSIKQQYASDLKSLTTSMSNITYKRLGKGFYVISGERNKQIFYQKTILKADAYCYAILEYNFADRNVYDPATADIARSFK